MHPSPLLSLLDSWMPMGPWLRYLTEPRSPNIAVWHPNTYLFKGIYEFGKVGNEQHSSKRLYRRTISTCFFKDHFLCFLINHIAKDRQERRREETSLIKEPEVLIPIKGGKESLNFVPSSLRSTSVERNCKSNWFICNLFSCFSYCKFWSTFFYLLLRVHP